MNSEILEKQKLLLLNNQESKCEQQRKEQATQIESDDDQQKIKSTLMNLKARIEELETECLIRNLDYKELREEFDNFKTLILKAENERLSKNIHLNEMLASTRDSSFDQSINWLPDLENFGEISEDIESIYDCYEDKRVLFIHDDNDSMSFPSEKCQNGKVRFIDGDCGYDLENKVKYDVEEIVKPSSSSSSSNKQTINYNKCDPLLDSFQNPATNSKQKTTSLNPYATSFFPGKDKNLCSNQEGGETQEIQIDIKDQVDSNSLLNIPYYTSGNAPYFTFLWDNPWQNRINVEEIHTRVQQTVKLYGPKVDVVSFSYLYFCEIDDLLNYEKSRVFNFLSKNHKKIIRNIITALLKHELDTNNTFIRNIEEYKNRGLIPNLPKKFKSYDDYSKSNKFQSLSKKKKMIIERLAKEEKKMKETD
ncbi:hypothetical protein C1645_841512 [Glomus cerebriforme]|uniref:Uncharacterized protein n=1 Tax=Glomus cerebriforme TaxID=658196 RepID=A0A397S543_9GLOM|nr:hypothetical protein C1645_882910 [Glomus cerebriforme]RIA79107.1 hypothetical protein C1645_841512 [Glomus cerebriforme]